MIRQLDIQKKEAIKRLKYLISQGVDTSVLKEFKSTGRITVFESCITQWQQTRRYENAGSNDINFIPKTYPYLDYRTEVDNIMIKLKKKAELRGYLPYAAIRTKTPDINKIDILNIDTSNYIMIYNDQYEDFVSGCELTMSYDYKTGKLIEGYTEYVIKYGYLIRKELE